MTDELQKQIERLIALKFQFADIGHYTWREGERCFTHTRSQSENLKAIAADTTSAILALLPSAQGKDGGDPRLSALIDLAHAVWHALEDSEDREDDGTVITQQNSKDMEDALNRVFPDQDNAWEEGHPRFGELLSEIASSPSPSKTERTPLPKGCHAVCQLCGDPYIGRRQNCLPIDCPITAGKRD